MLFEAIKKETGVYFPMYKSLWDLAKGKDTDEKRLAFYDTILDAAFDPENFVPPSQPIKGKSTPTDYAKWDAWNSVMHILERYFKAKKKRDMGRMYGKKGGRPKRIGAMSSSASDDDASYGAVGDEIMKLMMADEENPIANRETDTVTFEELNEVEYGVPKADKPLGNTPHSFDSFESFCAWFSTREMQFYTNMNICKTYCKDKVRIMREVYDRLLGSEWKDKNGKPINNMSKVVFWTLKYVAKDLKAEMEQTQKETASAVSGKTKAEIQDDLEERRRKRLKAAGAVW